MTDNPYYTEKGARGLNSDNNCVVLKRTSRTTSFVCKESDIDDVIEALEEAKELW